MCTGKYNIIYVQDVALSRKETIMLRNTGRTHDEETEGEEETAAEGQDSQED